MELLFYLACFLLLGPFHPVLKSLIGERSEENFESFQNSESLPRAQRRTVSEEMAAEGRSARKDSRSVKNPRTSDLGPEPPENKSTPFLRYRPGENSTQLDRDEIIIFNPRKKSPTSSGHPERRGTRISRPHQTDASFQIAAISYEIFLDGKLVTSETKFSENTRDLEVHPDEAEKTIKSFAPRHTFQKLGKDFSEFIRNGNSVLAKPTIVFLIWLQQDKKEDTKEGDEELEKRFGPKSLLYRHLMGTVRAAVFDTMTELVIMRMPSGMNFDRKRIRSSQTDAHLKSREQGTVTHSPTVRHLAVKGLGR